MHQWEIEWGQGGPWVNQLTCLKTFKQVTSSHVFRGNVLWLYETQKSFIYILEEWFFFLDKNDSRLFKNGARKTGYLHAK